VPADWFFQKPPKITAFKRRAGICFQVNTIRGRLWGDGMADADNQA
jgi:hypothetical protein